MKYLLTKKEYEELKDEPKKVRAAKDKIIQLLCTMVADKVPFKSWRNAEARPWGCVLSTENETPYCDDCLVRGVCPSDKKCVSK